METRKLTIFLTKDPTRLMRFLSWCSRSEYLHAAVGFEEDRDAYYSFGPKKGLHAERVSHYLRTGRAPLPCVLYELEVSEQVYQNAKRLIYELETQNHILSYTWLGAIMALLHIGYRKENSYFCSQFVADVLSRSQAVRLTKDSCLYLAQDLSRLPGMREIYCGDMLGMTQSFTQ